MLDKVYQFNTQLLGINREKIDLLSKQEKDWLLTALREEVQELEDAEGVVGSVDSLLDLIYFAIGGLVRMGLNPWDIDTCFNIVHEANMKKKMGVKATRPQDGSVADAVKPDDWQSPEEQMADFLLGRES